MVIGNAGKAFFERDNEESKELNFEATSDELKLLDLNQGINNI